MNNTSTATMKLETTDLTAKFETQACGRCGGSGRHSYCQMYGTTCFGCHGSGRVYSKRGEVAIKFLNESRTVKAGDIKPGWLMLYNGGPSAKSGWKTVREIIKQGSARYMDKVTGQWMCYMDIVLDGVIMSVFPDSTVLAVPSRANLIETKAAALQYQATLTKTGTVRRGRI